MATDTEMPADHQYPKATISFLDIRNQGSISFGRFAGESLAWEKWSVFSHNRCQEELEKFKAPGFVAQKKAYFEEYFRRYKAMKASEAEQQQSSQTESHHKLQSDIVQACINSNASVSSKGSKSHYKSQVQTLENVTSAVSSIGFIVDEPEAARKDQPSYRNDDNGKACTIQVTRKSLCAVELEHSANVASLSPSPSVTRSLEIGQHESLTPSSIEQSGHVTKEHSPPSKKKGNMVSDGKRTTLGSRTTQDGFKSCQEKKPSPRNKLTGRADNSVVLSKSSTSKSQRSNSNHISSKQLVGKCSDSTVLHTSLARNTLLSSSSCRSGQTKTNSNSKALAEKTRRRPHIQSVKNSTMEVTVSTCLTHKTGVNRSCPISRNSVELNGHRLKLRDQQSENQKPKAMCTNNIALNKSNKKTGAEVGKGSYIRGIKHEQVKVAAASSSSPLKRIMKPVKYQSSVSSTRDSKSMTMATSIHKNQTPIPKVTKSKSTDRTQAQRETRLTTCQVAAD